MDELHLPLDINGLENLQDEVIDAFKEEQYEKATKILNKILRIDSNYLNAYLLLAQIAYLNGDYQQAQDTLFQAKALPDLTADDHALIDLQILKNVTEEFIDRAKAFAQKGNSEKVKTNLIKALLIHPEHQNANIFYAVVLAGEGKYEQAIDILLQSLKRKNTESHGIIQLLLSNYYKEIYDFENSDLYLEVVAKNREKIEDPYLYYRLAEQSFRNGNYSKSTEYLDHYEKLLKKADDNQQEIMIFNARIGILRATDNIQRIIREGHKYLENIKKGNADFNVFIGNHYAQAFEDTDDVDGLLDLVDIIQKEKPTENSPYFFDQYYLGLVEEIRGNYVKSLHYFKEVKRRFKNWCKIQNLNFTKMWPDYFKNCQIEFEPQLYRPTMGTIIDNKIKKYSVGLKTVKNSSD